MIYNIHGGHNFNVPGASGYFSETSEDRKVKNLVIEKLRTLGHIVYDCTDEDGTTVNQNLSNIVKKCNSNSVDLDISIHFNASGCGGHGVEVWCYNNGTASVATKICNEISNLGFKNRGVKYSTQLYVLRNTKAAAILIECCFCDSQTDSSIYDPEKMATSIVKGLTGQTVNNNNNNNGNGGGTNFKVKVSTTDLRIRTSPSLSGGIKGYVPCGVYTIVQTKNSDGYEWGKLKSGAGWIALKFTTRV